MMTVLEEDFRELKPVTAHPLFNGNIMARKRKEALSKIRSRK